MNIVIVGCGRIGAYFATVLDQQGHNVAIIDVRQDAFQHLPLDFNGLSILGTGIDEDILRSAGIAEADVFIALTGFDNTNLMSSQVAKHVFNVPRVSARIYDPIRADIFAEMGIETVCVTKLLTEVMLSKLAISPVSG